MAQRLRALRDTRLHLASGMSDQPCADFMIGEATRALDAAMNMMAALRDHTGDAQGVTPGEGGAHPGHQLPASDPADNDVDAGMDDHITLIQVNGGAATDLQGAKATEKQLRSALGTCAALN
eukprot:1089767-Pyramimonas_sp.AAC.1